MDLPPSDISRLLNPSLSDDKTDHMTNDMGLDFSESSKFDPDNVLGSSYSLVREGDDPVDLDLSIAPSFETGLPCSPPSCFDNASSSSSSTLTNSVINSRCPTSSIHSTSARDPSSGQVSGVQLLSSLNARPVVIGNVTAETLVTAVLNAKKAASSEPHVAVSATPAAAGIWVLNTPPIIISQDILNLVKPMSLPPSVQSLVEHMDTHHRGGCVKPVKCLLSGTSEENNVVHYPFETSTASAVGHMDNVAISSDTSKQLQEGTHMVLKSADTQEVHPTSFLRLDDLMKTSCSSAISVCQTELLDSIAGSDHTNKRKLLCIKSEGSESNSFSELFSYHDLPVSGDVTSLHPDQPILQCSSSEELQDIEYRFTSKESQNTFQDSKFLEVATPPLPPVRETRKSMVPSTLIIEGLQEGSRLVKELPSHNVPILPKDSEGKMNAEELKTQLPVQTSTPVVVHLIRNSDFADEDILYCQNMTTTLTEDLGHDLTEDDLDSPGSKDNNSEGSNIDDQREANVNPETVDFVPEVVGERPAKRYKRNSVSSVKKTYKCDLCSLKFNFHGNYTRHRKIHLVTIQESKQHNCQTCGRMFLQKCDMKRHMLIHLKKEPHKCEVCGKGYIRHSDLVVHMRFHNKDRSYKCDQCPKQYYQSGDLRRHIRTNHSTQAMMQCGHCPRVYANEATLIRHMQMRHKDIILKSLSQKLQKDKGDKGDNLDRQDTTT